MCLFTLAMPVLCWQGSSTDVFDGLLGLSHCEAPNQLVERFQMGQKYSDQADPMRPGREECPFSLGIVVRAPDYQTGPWRVGHECIRTHGQPKTSPRPAHDPIGRRRAPICHPLPNHGIGTFSRPLPFPPQGTKS
ncbi:hypothetical protein F5B18DRAFT_251732 [Nemania serpens]|nr:hypothetical protein F5B18DRAFT_251732 [Nemania serpens]